MGGVGRAVVAVPPESHNPLAAVPVLVNKRLLFLVGKGGVGKTTIATALALAFSKQGKKTLLIEFDENTRAARLLGLPPLDKPTDVLRQVSPTLFVLATSGHAALEEYLRLIIPVKRLLRTVVESRLYQYFVAAAPGLKELLTMGKVWYEERRRDGETQQPRWDVLIVDTPATGHSLQYLRMPRAARDTFREGLVHREAEQLLTLLSDPSKTVVNLVTTPEELPVSETQEAYQQLAEDLRLPLGVLFINRVHWAPLPRTVLEHARVDVHVATQERRLARQVLARARAEATLAEAQASSLRHLRHLPLPAVHVPFCFAEEFGLAQVERLSRLIEAAILERPGEKGEKRKRRRGEVEGAA
ncbi:MAG: ArsA family ATPase [Deltaproteobacteria bacterium]|nr:ArsA family ATPase [Deltaproteobacteria bacterium]